MLTSAIKNILLVVIMAFAVLGTAACSTMDGRPVVAGTSDNTKTARNAGRGAVLGAGAGAIVGAAATGNMRGAVVGAAAGAGTGAIIGAVASRDGNCRYQRADGSTYVAPCPEGY